MFGLTRREQYWNAQQRALDTFAEMLVELARTQANASEIERLRAENAELRAKQGGQS